MEHLGIFKPCDKVCKITKSLREAIDDYRSSPVNIYSKWPLISPPNYRSASWFFAIAGFGPENPQKQIRLENQHHITPGFVKWSTQWTHNWFLVRTMNHKDPRMIRWKLSSDEDLDNHGGSTCQSLQVSSIFFCNHWVGFKEHRNSLVFAMKYGRLLGKVSPSDFELRINSSMCLCMAFLQAMWRVWTREKMDIYIYIYADLPTATCLLA